MTMHQPAHQPLAPRASPQVDARDYGVAAHMLRDLGVHSVALMTNNPAKAASLQAHGIEVTQQLALLPGGGVHANGSDGASALGAAHEAAKGRNGSEAHCV